MVLQFLWRKDFLLHGTYSRKTLNILICVLNWLYFIQCLTSFSNPSANVFAFGDFNIHHKDWLTYSGGTDRPGELGCKFFNLKWLMTLIVLLLRIYIFLLVLVFVLQWFSLHSGHVIVSVSIDFLLTGKVITISLHDYFCPDWEGVHCHLWDVPWEDILKLGGYAAAGEFCEWVQVKIDVHIPHRKY